MHALQLQMSIGHGNIDDTRFRKDLDIAKFYENGREVLHAQRQIAAGIDRRGVNGPRRKNRQMGFRCAVGDKLFAKKR